MPSDLSFTPITEIGPRIAAGAVRCGDLLDACVRQMERYEPALNAFIRPTLDVARRQAQTLDDEVRRGHVRGPLHGIPIAVKDLIDLEGVPTTAGSAILKDQIAVRTATALERLLDAGAVLVGKTNLDEFARGGTSLDSFFGPTCNPWNQNHTPGSSSSGSAVAVASGMSLAAVGTDTGGSVVGPAGFCNLVGMRPTYGRVSRAGVIPLGPSFDTVGPLTRTVGDAAALLQVMAGADPLDRTTGAAASPDFLASIHDGLAGLTIGVPVDFVWPGYEPEVEGLVRAAIKDLESAGARVVEVQLPWTALCRPVYNGIVAPESAEYHRTHLRERRDAYISPGAGFFEQGLFMPGWRYVQAQKTRTLFLRQAAAVFRVVDAIVAPTSPIAPPSFEECRKGGGTAVWAPISHCKRPFGPLGVPALQVPVGFTAGRLPVGMQVVGRWGEEALLFRIGASYEALRPWWKTRPPLDDPPAPVAGFSDWARAAADDIAPGPAAFSDAQVAAFAKAVGHRVAPSRLATLTADVNRELTRLAALDSVSVGDYPRADLLDFLTLNVHRFPV